MRTQIAYGSSILETLNKNNIVCKIKIIALPDKFIEHGLQETLREKYGLTKENIIDIVKEMLK